MKKSICLFVIILVLTGCSKGTSESGMNEKNVPTQSAQQESGAPAAQEQEGTEGFWKESAVSNAQEENILSYANGLQIILPKEWDGEIVASSGDDNTLTVADKRNVEKGAGGVMFYLAYFEKKGVSTKYPYAIDKGFDTVLGTYKVNGEEYALIQELPTEMNYVEGDEELEKHYEYLYASVDKVQIITDKMPGFTKCGIDDLNWIIYNTYE